MRSKPNILALLLFLSSGLLAQQLRFKHLTSEDGLSTNSVKAVLQDDRGFMWFGTQDGLNKYNGYDFTVFRNIPGQNLSLSSSYITALEQVNPSCILVGTHDGLNFLDPMTEQFTILDLKGSGRRQVNAILKLNDGEALLGTDGGLFLIDTKGKKIKKDFFGARKIAVTCLEQIDDRVFIGTAGNSLWMMERGKEPRQVQFTSDEHSRIALEPLASVTAIGWYGSRLYLSVPNSGIYRCDRNFEIESVISLSSGNGLPVNVRDFIIRNNRIYAASSAGVLVYSLVSGRQSTYSKKDELLSLSSNLCNCIYEDDAGNLWVGTDQGGINVSFFRSQKFPLSTDGFETRVNDITAIFELDPRTVLIGGAGYLKQLDLETGDFISYPGFESAEVQGILPVSGQHWLIGTDQAGLVLFDCKSKKQQTILNLPDHEFVTTLAVAGDLILAGTNEGGIYYSAAVSPQPEFQKAELPLKTGAIHCFYFDTSSSLYIGTAEQGLVRASLPAGNNLKVQRHFYGHGKAGQLSSNTVFGVRHDSRGNLWVATSAGLNKLKGDTSFHSFYNRSGLVNSYLQSILLDSLGHFWLSSNNGLVHFDPIKPEQEVVFKNYNLRDGLVNTEFSPGAYHQGGSGALYFGGTKGFNRFFPAQIKGNLRPPRVYLVSYKRSGTTVEADTQITYKKSLQLSWTENYFQFEVAALDYSDPGKNLFRYKLEGYDKDWSSPSNVRFVSYTQLPGGDYVLKVKTANSDGIWNEQPQELRITVVPPFWKTKAFYAFAALFGLGMIYAYTQYRTRSVLRENRLLEAKVAARTRELEEKNRDITSSIEYARRIQEAILPSRESIFTKLKKVFILYQPKDIVSGDFYWFAEAGGYKIFAVVDCTGHGVPGAFMSMIGHNLLHQIVLEKGITEPGEILGHLHRGVQAALRQGRNEISTNDGMDVSLLAIRTGAREILWAGANRPLVVVDEERNLIKYDGNKYPVGGAQIQNERIFLTHRIPLTGPSMAYMFTDGYADQFGGDRGKKFMVKRFHEILAEIHLLDAEEQRHRLQQRFQDWKSNHEQVDDVLIVGIQV